MGYVHSWSIGGPSGLGPVLDDGAEDEGPAATGGEA